VAKRPLAEALEQQAATSEVLGVISSSRGDLPPIFETMLENAVRLCGAKFGSLVLRERDGFCVVAMHNAFIPLADRCHSISCHSDAIRSGEVTRVH
jgi:hypothetical protein